MTANRSARRDSTFRICFIGLMAAIACVSNYISIPFFASRFHVGNAVCVLCGLLLGPASGFLAAGIGNGLFDIIGGYGLEFIITFINKGAIALVTGLIAYKTARKTKLEKADYVRIVIGCVIGAFVAIMRLSRSKVLNAIATAYTEVIRDTPLLLQLYFFYFLLPDLLPAMRLSKFTCIAVALLINSGAYMSEVFRSGIQSVDRGQTEAARSLGLSASQTLTRIVLPQAFKNVLPAMCNEFVAVTKETSLASTFYVGDLMTQYQTISGKTYLVIEPLVIIGVIYFVVTFTMSKLIAVLERRLKSGD